MEFSRDANGKMMRDGSSLPRRELKGKVVEKCVLWIVKSFRWNNLIFLIKIFRNFSISYRRGNWNNMEYYFLHCQLLLFQKNLCSLLLYSLYFIFKFSSFSVCPLSTSIALFLSSWIFLNIFAVLWFISSSKSSNLF